MGYGVCTNPSFIFSGVAAVNAVTGIVIGTGAGAGVVNVVDGTGAGAEREAVGAAGVIAGAEAGSAQTKAAAEDLRKDHAHHPCPGKPHAPSLLQYHHTDKDAFMGPNVWSSVFGYQVNVNSNIQSFAL